MVGVAVEQEILDRVKDTIFEVGTVVLPVVEPYDKETILQALADWTYAIVCEDGTTIVFPFLRRGVQLLDNKIVVFDTVSC